MRLKDREKRIVGLGLVAALGIVAWTYVVSPMQQRWRRANTLLKTNRAELAKLDRAAADKRQSAGRREQVAGQVIETTDLEASQRVIPVLINEVESCGRQRRIQILRYDPLPPKIEENLATYSLNLSLHSDLGALIEFLKDLREAQPVVHINRLHVTPPGPDSKTQDLTVELVLSTFAIRKAKGGA